jgi:hypothetical protein
VAKLKVILTSGLLILLANCSLLANKAASVFYKSQESKEIEAMNCSCGPFKD